MQESEMNRLATDANSGASNETNESMEPTLVAILAAYASDGFDRDAFAAPDGRLLCGSCQSLIAPDHIAIQSIRRLEGQSDPADMMGVVAIICPVCDAHATAVLKFGPEASHEENQIWQRTTDERSSDTLPGNSAPGEVEDASESSDSAAL